MKLDREPVIHLVPATFKDLLGVAELMRAFLSAIRKRLPPDPRRDAALHRFDKLYACCANGERLVLSNDLVALDAAFLVFSVFLLVYSPSSEKRERMLEYLHYLRASLAVVRRDEPPPSYN